VRDARILVVDNECRVLDVMVDVLREAGYSPRSTSESREAAKLLETSAFDLIVCDVLMPGLNGFQLMEVARRENPDIRVVFVTGYTTPEVTREAVKRGAAGIVEKPFRTEELLAAVRESLEDAPT